jgi:hypothetical protein
MAADPEVDDADDGFPVSQGSETSTPAATPAQGTAARPAPSPSPAAATFAWVQDITTGADLLITMPGDRISVQVFASTPPDITLKLSMVDPLGYPATPGIRAGDLIFQLEAFDAAGLPLETLPAEVSLSVLYGEPDIVGLDESTITLSRLNPLDQQWMTATNLLADPTTNSVMASVVDVGVYAVHVL